MYLTLARITDGAELAKVSVRSGGGNADLYIDSLNPQYGFEQCTEIWHFFTEAPLPIRTENGLKQFIPVDKQFLQAIVIFLSQNPCFNMKARLVLEDDSLEELKNVLFTFSENVRWQIVFRLYKLVLEQYGLMENQFICLIIKALERGTPVEPIYFVRLLEEYDEECIPESFRIDDDEFTDGKGNPIATNHIKGLFQLVARRPDIALECIWQSALMPENETDFLRLFRAEIQGYLENTSVIS